MKEHDPFSGDTFHDHDAPPLHSILIEAKLVGKMAGVTKPT